MRGINRINYNSGQSSLFWPVLRFTVQRLVLVRMLEAAARRAPRRGRPDKMVRLSAHGARVFVEANGKAASTEALVFSEGSCLLVHRTILTLLRGFARSRRNITFQAEPALFCIDTGNWPLAAFSPRVFPPEEFQDLILSLQPLHAFQGSLL